MNNERLEPNNEKRMDGRSDCKGIFKWSYFNHSNFFGGELLNFSQKGFYFETSCVFRSIPAGESGRSRPPISIDSGRPISVIQLKPALVRF